MANLKFKSCWRCQAIKTNPLEKNWIRPNQTVCRACDYEMLVNFLQCLGIEIGDIRAWYKSTILGIDYEKEETTD